MRAWIAQLFRSRNILAIAFIMYVVSGLNFVARAQTNTATISGTVADITGASVPDVVITLSSKATGLKRQAATNDEGYYVLSLLPPGVYSLEAQNEGFSDQQVEGIELPIAGQISRDITLAVGEIQETVSVSGGALLLQSETSTLADVVSNKQIDELPISGRDFRPGNPRLSEAVPVSFSSV